MGLNKYLTDSVIEQLLCNENRKCAHIYSFPVHKAVNATWELSQEAPDCDGGLSIYGTHTLVFTLHYQSKNLMFSMMSNTPIGLLET